MVNWSKEARQFDGLWASNVGAAPNANRLHGAEDLDVVPLGFSLYAPTIWSGNLGVSDYWPLGYNDYV